MQISELNRSTHFLSKVPLPVLGISYEFFTQPITTLHTVLEKKYGQVYGLHMGTLPLLNVSDPEIVKAIVQKDSQNFLDISVMKFKQKFFKDSFMLKSGKTQKLKSGSFEEH